MPALLIALAVVMGIPPGLALAQQDGLDSPAACSGANDDERFELCNACRPMRLLVQLIEGPNNDAVAIGLTEDRLRVAAESRLRAAQLYTEDPSKAGYAFLHVSGSVLHGAFSFSVNYVKYLSDPVSGKIRGAVTWQFQHGATLGTHARDSGFIVQSISEAVDKFLVEYLRVNEKDCPR